MLLGAHRTIRAVFLTAGRPVLQRALALWAATGIVAMVLFAGNGMRARDLTHLFHGSAAARIALGSIWVVLATPVVSCAFDAPGTRTLRALPVRLRSWTGSLLVLLLLVQAPCGVLFARGDGLLSALVTMLLATATEAAFVAASRRPRWMAVGGAAMALAVLDLRPWLAALPAAGLATVAVRAAWKVALDGAGLEVRMTRPTFPVLAITAAHLLRIVRVSRARLAIAGTSALCGAIALGLSLHNDPSARPVARALTVLSFPIALGAAILAGPVRETEGAIRALARVTRTRWPTLLAAFALALGVPSSALAATAGGLAGTFAGSHALAPVLALSSSSAAWAVPLACVIAAWARWHDRRTRGNPALFVAGVFVVAGVATGVAAAW